MPDNSTPKHHHNKMGTEPIGKLLLSMSLPAMFSMLIQALYNIVDSIYVAQIGEHALTAVSLAFPVQNLMIAVSVGTGVGLNSLISRRLGERREKEASAAATHGVLISFAESLLFLLFGLFFCRMFFSAFTSDSTVIQMGVDYTSIVTIFSFGSFIQINLEKTLQATGNMFYPMVFQLIGAITNIILDPIFIFGWFGLPAMGVAGAAIATVAGQILAMLYAVYVMVRKEHAVHITFKGFHFSGAIVRDIFQVGFPSIIMQSIGSVMIMALNNILIVFSQAAVAVLGVYFKLQSFVFMPVFGLGAGALPIMGFNYGARNKKRLMHTLQHLRHCLWHHAGRSADFPVRCKIPADDVQRQRRYDGHRHLRSAHHQPVLSGCRFGHRLLQLFPSLRRRQKLAAHLGASSVGHPAALRMDHFPHRHPQSGLAGISDCRSFLLLRQPAADPHHL